jgi:hypothetical protein
MNSLIRRLAAFMLCMTIGFGLSALLRTVVSSSASSIPALQLKEASQIQEITMKVIYDWCGGRECPDYEITIQRQGSEDYYSSVTRVGLKSREIKRGNMYRVEFEKLAQVLESQSFFSLDDVYPNDGACADCVISKVTAVRDGRRKKVVHLYDEMPLQLWTIQRTLQGVEKHIQWLKN